MSKEHVQLLIIKGAISELPPEGQAKIAELADVIRKLRADNGDEGHIAIVLVCAEIAAEDDE